ncbi:MAG: hypothetical protein CUN55_14575, partial [Phototrophicales bacterium]
GKVEELFESIKNAKTYSDEPFTSHLGIEFKKPHQIINRIPLRVTQTNTIKSAIENAKAVPFKELALFVNKRTHCLWHNDKHPSLYLYEKENRCVCFVCGKSVDTIDYIMKRDNVRFIDAVKLLAPIPQVDVGNTVLCDTIKK